MNGWPGRIVPAAIVLACVSASGCSGTSAPPQPADQAKATVPGSASSATAQPVNTDAKAMAGFLDRVNSYVTLHLKLENTLPKLSKESTPEQIDAHQRALGKLLRDARRD